MLDLDSPRWKILGQAYGFAHDVPRMLRRLATHPDKKAWEDIWSSLCHQGTVYSATVAAIPHIVEFARRNPSEPRFAYWNFVGAVASDASSRLLETFPDLMEDYFKALKEAEPEIRQSLELRPPREETVYLLSALLAVKGARGEAQVLEHLSDEEVPGQCPGCSEYLYVRFDKDVILVENQEDDSKFSILSPPAPVSEPKSAGNLEISRASEWLPVLANAAGHAGLASQIRVLFGRASCPDCARSFEILPEFSRQLVPAT